jgi:hypothetical protein
MEVWSLVWSGYYSLLYNVGEEGRRVKYKVDLMVDYDNVDTLTGSCIHALTLALTGHAVENPEQNRSSQIT